MTVYFDDESPRAEILQAALEEFVAFGKPGARMQSIADRAGVNKALLHYYFSSKENLHREVLQRVFRHGFTSISASMEDNADPRDQIRELITSYFSFIRQFPELPRLVIMEITTDASVLVENLSGVFSGEPLPFPQKVLQVIEEGVKQKIFLPVDPRQLLITIISLVVFYFIGKPLLVPILQIEDEDAFLDARIEHVQNTVLAAIERTNS